MKQEQKQSCLQKKLHNRVCQIDINLVQIGKEVHQISKVLASENYPVAKSPHVWWQSHSSVKALMKTLRHSHQLSLSLTPPNLQPSKWCLSKSSWKTLPDISMHFKLTSNLNLSWVNLSKSKNQHWWNWNFESVDEDYWSGFNIWKLLTLYWWHKMKNFHNLHYDCLALWRAEYKHKHKHNYNNST